MFEEGEPLFFMQENQTAIKQRMSEMIEGKQVERRKAFEILKKSELSSNYFQAGDKFIDDNPEPTVDGIHPTDSGMYLIAESLLPLIIKNLKKSDF